MQDAVSRPVSWPVFHGLFGRGFMAGFMVGVVAGLGQERNDAAVSVKKVLIAKSLDTSPWSFMIHSSGSSSLSTRAPRNELGK